MDESGLPSDSLFAIGGVAVEGARWHELAASWARALSAHRWPARREIKWHGIQTGEVPPALADELFAVLGNAGITSFVVLLRPRAGRAEAPELVASDEAVYTTALKFLLERFERWLVRREGYGVVVVDSRLPDVDARLRAFYERLHREGTEYVRLERLVDALLLGPSHHSIGLQAADLLVGSAPGGAGTPRRRLALAAGPRADARAASRHRRGRGRRARRVAEGPRPPSPAVGEALSRLRPSGGGGRHLLGGHLGQATERARETHVAEGTAADV